MGMHNVTMQLWDKSGGRFVSITGAMKTTPTAGMEALLNLPPLQLAIQEKAAIQALSIHTKEKYKQGNLIGHLEILNRVENATHMTQESDHTDAVLRFTKRCKVIFPSRDGSKTLQDVGAGILGPKAHKSITR
ncbi:PREDICTED: uncharacterized protein LOC108379408 [Rhagoletis zephyria]|uniref:uncharacterized protein LOC108379408 n=1 Tax=Rhagoletis zephyria TaxID=28612 RepID=UPI000811898E|nr:PREDICTED: uncharacterized protein LOC108379408 [Rhagoletis zephyria]